MTVEHSSNNNPQFHRTAWAEVVRGEREMSAAPSSSSPSPPSPSPSSVATAEQPTFTDCSGSKETQVENSDVDNSNVAHPKKPAWNKPLNGVIAVGPVMGDVVSWPALSESTKPPPPKSTSDSSKLISDSSVSTSQGPLISHSPQNQKHANANANANPNPKPNFTPNHTMPIRQRSSKRGGGGGTVQSGFIRPPPPPPLPPPFPLFEMPYVGGLVAAVPDSSLREPPYNGNSWGGRPMGGFVSQSHSLNDQSSQRNSSRRGNFGGRFRGNGLHQNSHGSRRDHDRDWNASRSSSATDVHVPQPIGAPPRGFMRPLPPPGSTPFIVPQPVRPFGNLMGFDMTSPFFYVPTLPPESFMGMPFIAHHVPPPPPPPMLFPVLDTTLPTSLVNQIDYYFSDANLVKDNFLKSKMDPEGWVPIALIAGFPRVKQLTNNIQLILDSLRASSVVEVQGSNIRRKWKRVSGQLPTDSGSQSPIGSTYDTITTSLQKVTLDKATANRSGIMGKADSSTEVVSSEELTDHSKVANGEL